MSNCCCSLDVNKCEEVAVTSCRRQS